MADTTLLTPFRFRSGADNLCYDRGHIVLLHWSIRRIAMCYAKEQDS
jgi:hypothetical protein